MNTKNMYLKSALVAVFVVASLAAGHYVMACGSNLCSTDADCGVSGWTGTPVCQGNAVYQNYTAASCMQRNQCGEIHNYCANTTTLTLKETCAAGLACSNGACVGGGSGGGKGCENGATTKCVGNAVYWFDSCGNPQGISQVCQSNQTCSNATCVTGTSNQATLSLQKQVRNMTAGSTTFAASTTASPSDVVLFSVTVRNTGTQTISNVVLKDTMPQNLFYNDNLSVDNVSNAGSIVTGINTGGIAPGQTRTVTYQAKVAQAQNFSFGTTTLTNMVTVTSDSNPSQTASANVYVTRSLVYGATSVSTGETNYFLQDSFFLPLALLLALMIGWSFRENIAAFAGLGASSKNISMDSDVLTTEEMLNRRISEIKKSESK